MNRSDQRQPDQLRPIQIIRQYTKFAPGSVLVAFGDTKVLVTASVEERVPRHILVDKPDGHGWLTAEYAMLPGATQTRNQRERLKIGGRSQEIQRLIGRTLRASIDLSKLGTRTITIDADVIQADGGTRVASITGGYVAMMDALNGLVTQGLLSELPPVKPVAAVSVGIIDGTELLDLNYEEDFRADVDANVVMNADGDLIEFQASSEGAPFSRANMNRLLDLSEHGIRQLIAIQQQALQQGSYGAPSPAMA